jgi:hypothetical protein
LNKGIDINIKLIYDPFVPLTTPHSTLLKENPPIMKKEGFLLNGTETKIDPQRRIKDQN